MMDFNAVTHSLKQRFEDYHDGLVTRVDEQFVTHCLLCFALIFAIPHITHLLWMVWLHYFLTVFSSPFRTGWWD
jgi:hypothetical protein